MADIAMLVAEEYERRVKNSRKDGEFWLVQTWLPVFQFWLRPSEKIGKEKMEFLVKWIKEEPRSQIGLEASKGFFSA